MSDLYIRHAQLICCIHMLCKLHFNKLYTVYLHSVVIQFISVIFAGSDNCWFILYIKI